MEGHDSVPVIIEAALNGATDVRDNPHVPSSSAELVDNALACLEAGASVIHTHAPDPSLRAKEAAQLYVEHFKPILAARPDALLYPTIVFHDPIEERIGHLPILAEQGGLRIGLMEPGSGSFVRTGDDRWDVHMGVDAGETGGTPGELEIISSGARVRFGPRGRIRSRHRLFGVVTFTGATKQRIRLRMGDTTQFPGAVALVCNYADGCGTE